MTVQERKTIFALCGSLELSEEERHTLIYGVTGKESTKELTSTETKAVIAELMERSKYKNRSEPLENRKPKAYAPREAGMITPEQQSLAWRLVYRLKELDEGGGASVGERMTGAIKKLTGTNMVKPGKEIFCRVTAADGNKLIEGLKRYVRSAENKAKKGKMENEN